MVVVVETVVVGVVVVVASVTILFKTFFSCVLILSFLIRSVSLLNNVFQSSCRLSSNCFSGVLFQRNELRLILVAQPQSPIIRIEKTLTQIHSHRLAAALYCLGCGGIISGVGLLGIFFCFFLGILTPKLRNTAKFTKDSGDFRSFRSISKFRC